MNIEQHIRELVEEKIADRPDLFLVDVKMAGGNKVIILLDGDNGAGIAECAMVSRHVGFKLEEEDAIAEPYNLEVGTPGIDTPLVLLRQYDKNVGRQVAVKLADGSKKEGELLDASESEIVIEEIIKSKGKKAEPVETTIPMAQITETKVLISFK